MILIVNQIGIYYANNKATDFKGFFIISRKYILHLCRRRSESAEKNTIAIIPDPAIDRLFAMQAIEDE